MERANRISVQAMEDGSFEARFFRTHKQVAVIRSNETGWVADPKQNRTLQREMFRLFIQEHAADIEVDWDPEDKRTDMNRRAPKYESDALLLQDAQDMVTPDISGFVAGCKMEGLELVSVVAEEITPMVKSPKGTELGKLGILDGKYANGNWAWAIVKVVATVKLGEQEAYVTMECQLVSGQLKKPTAIDDGGFTQTAFKAAVAKDIKVEESKQDSEEPKTEEEPKPETKQESKKGKKA